MLRETMEKLKKTADEQREQCNILLSGLLPFVQSQPYKIHLALYR